MERRQHEPSSFEWRSREWIELLSQFCLRRYLVLFPAGAFRDTGRDPDRQLVDRGNGQAQSRQREASEEEIRGAAPVPCAPAIEEVIEMTFETRQGNPCRRGHSGLRFVTSRGCVECVRDRMLTIRAEAVITGVKTKMGKPCIHGHDGLRYVKGGACVACAKYRAEKQRADDPEKIRLVNALWRANNSEALARSKAVYAKNNPEKIRSGNRNAKARRKNADGFHRAADIDRIRRIQDDCCFYCREPLECGGHTEHFVCIKKGGSNWPENLCLACSDCNLSKGTKDPVEWIIEQEFVGIVIEIRDEIFMPLHSKVTPHDNRY